MNEWLQYESMRMALDYALGTMQIDENGQWIDPGSMSNICPMQRGNRGQGAPYSSPSSTNTIVNPFAEPRTANDILEDVLNGTSDFNSPAVPTTSPFTPEEIALPPVEPVNAVPESNNSAAPYSSPEVTNEVPEVASPEVDFLDEDSQIREIVEEAIPDAPVNTDNEPAVRVLSGARDENIKPTASPNLLPEKTPELEPIELPDAPLPIE